MIEGIYLDISSDQLRDHLNSRVAYHQSKKTSYEAKRRVLADVDLSEASSSYTPQQSFDQKIQQHADRARVLAFMAEYIIPDETYRLSENDLRSLELLDRYF